MLAANAAVDAMLGKIGKNAIWDVNTEDDYHEQRHAVA
jgi:hypothetical protein